jgi:Region found in RelA / SpoT proteins
MTAAALSAWPSSKDRLMDSSIATLVESFGFDDDSILDDALEVEDMSTYPHPRHAPANVIEAGKLITGDIDWDENSQDTIIDAFRVANNWRDSHAFPMRSIRSQLVYFIGELGLKGVSGARLKTMPSVRKKLRLRPHLDLHILQDFGGCRVILDNMNEVTLLVDALTQRSRHKCYHRNDYIAKPKDDGYRSYHLMYEYNHKPGKERFAGLRIEIQIRTKIQHAWSTAVETVGLYLGEDFKSAKTGNPEWLRLFQLLSGELAVAEGSPVNPLVANREERIREIRDLNKKLGAISLLDNISAAVRYTDDAVSEGSRPTYYLLKYDRANALVSVEPYFISQIATTAYDAAEADEIRNLLKNNSNIVLVEADKIDNLKFAYPNYFGDVSFLKASLKRIVDRNGLREYELNPQERIKTGRRAVPISSSWLTRPRFSKPKGA